MRSKTDLKAIDDTDVSALYFGCMQFGSTADGQASRDMYETCRAAGVNFFDTAHTYTGDEAERLLGLFSRQDRERLKITTKASYTGDSGRKNILRQFDESRARMDLDMIDILLFASPVS